MPWLPGAAGFACCGTVAITGRLRLQEPNPMQTADSLPPASSLKGVQVRPSPLQRFSTFLYNRPWLLLALLLGPPLLAFGLFYLGSLSAMLVQSLYRLDSFTGLVVREFTLATYAELF